MNFIKSLKEKIEWHSYNETRKNYIYESISDYGKIVEENDKIICYVTQDKASHRLHCLGMQNSAYELKKYNLDKPIYYIFNGIRFKNLTTLETHSHNIHVIFKNCTFVNGLKIVYADDVTLEDNKYISSNNNTYTSFYSFIYPFIDCAADKLTIKNDSFIDNCYLKHCKEIKFGINIKAQKLCIINSNMRAENKGQICINASNLDVSNSTIEGPEIYIDSDNISFEKILLKSEKGVIIENKNYDFDLNFEASSPYIIYNGIEMIKNGLLIVNKEQLDLYKKRQKLLSVLKNIRNECNNIYDDEAKKIQDDFYQQQVIKAIKK
ncbi:MAG: hypothetical protein NC181_01460 [Clostridium sp.]|nr:hypothetical protein [Clostridium sp.]MCM1444494.1 hypothetical protein [Candidatus Amulumruptor caecigallinarius]